LLLEDSMREAMGVVLDQQRQRLARLSNASLFRDMFPISCGTDGVATIAGLRVGRTPVASTRLHKAYRTSDTAGSDKKKKKSKDDPDALCSIPWPEVNAGLGEMVLLCVCIARQLSLPQRQVRYVLVPRASRSMVKVRAQDNDADTRNVELYVNPPMFKGASRERFNI
ncbi:Atg6/Beclin, partial [Kipferlia bialata]